MRKLTINLLLLFCSLSASFYLVEKYLSVAPFPNDSIKPAYCKDYEKKTIERYMHSISNYAYPPNTDLPLCSTDFLVVNTSDADGYLGAADSSNTTPILVFGDSFAYGFGVKKNEAFASIIGAYNAGLWGNSFPNHVQVLKHLLQKGKRFDVAVWVIYPPHLITVSDGGWQTRTNLSKEDNPWLYQLAEMYNETHLSKTILATVGWGLNKTDYYTPEWSLYDSQDNYADSGYLVFERAAKEIKDISNTYHIKIIPLIIPSKAQIALSLDKVRPLFKPPWIQLDANLASQNLSKILDHNGLFTNDQIIILDEIIKYGDRKSWRNYYFANDAHLNTSGHKFVARALSEKINAGSSKVLHK